MDTKTLPSVPDYLAPDGSEIRLLLSTQRGGLCHCTLPPGKTSKAVRHRSVEEIWYVLAGRGEVWRSGTPEGVTPLAPGLAIAIVDGCCFQFRNTGADPLMLLISTMPRWPGAEEAVTVDGRW